MKMQEGSVALEMWYFKRLIRDLCAHSKANELIEKRQLLPSIKRYNVGYYGYVDKRLLLEEGQVSDISLLHISRTERRLSEEGV